MSAESRVIAALWLFSMGCAVGWIALRGDDIRAHRQGMTTEEMLEQERKEIADQISAYRAENPNTSRCGWPCIERMPTTGETWGE